ncbi:MAG: CHAT domain-containing protein, partial [Acidobacteria bacterium]|nr:CHAT domain-containing protein [Acidobacteriota bacterium]
VEERRADAWQALDEADRWYLRTANVQRFAVAMQRSALLSDAGAGHEAVETLRQRLGECDATPCDADLLAAGHLQLARLVLNDPFRTRVDLETARTDLETAAGQSAPSPDPTRQLSVQLVDAALALELGEVPSALPDRDREILATLPEGPRREAFEGWWTWLDAQAALARGEPDRALEACRSLTRLADRALVAWGWSCVARAHHARGDLASADLAYAKTLAHQEYLSGARLGLALAAGLGPQAEDAARAARVAVELGRPERAWEVLARIDQRSAHEAERSRCREAARSAREVAAWESVDREIDALLAQLAAVELPGSVAREAEAEGVRRALQERLSMLWRTWPGCAGGPGPEADGAEYRAFTVDDEVVLLGRRHGVLRLVRRTFLPAAALARIAGEVGEAMAAGRLEDSTWRRLLAPVAAALLPDDLEALASPVTFALHGRLQAFPVAALPVSGEGSARWLGDLAVIALQPAGARAAVSAPQEEVLPPVFVVDPLGDLPHARRSAARYRQWFPEARVLERTEASRAVLSGPREHVEWLHLDTHASYEPAFPELSSLVLADGPLRLVELVRMPAPRRFANLSGCRTGSWRPTADSGRYGLGGLLA